MKTLAILAFALTACQPLQDTEPAGVSQIGVLNLFRGTSEAGDVHQEAEAASLVRSDHEEGSENKSPVVLIEPQSSR